MRERPIRGCAEPITDRRGGGVIDLAVRQHHFGGLLAALQFLEQVAQFLLADDPLGRLPLRRAARGAQGALGYHNETVKVGDARYAACYDFSARNVFFTALCSTGEITMSERGWSRR